MESDQGAGHGLREGKSRDHLNETSDRRTMSPPPNSSSNPSIPTSARDSVCVTNSAADFAEMKTPARLKLLLTARGVRGFGDGFAIIILPAYLAAVGFDPVQIGIAATASLLGTAF